MEVIFHFFTHLALMLKIPSKSSVVVAVLASLLVALKVVVTGRAFFRAIGLASMLDDVLHPPLFGLIFDIKSVMAVGTHVIDTRSDMIALCLQHLRQVELEGGLISAHDEQVGKTCRMNAQQSPDALGVLVLKIHAARAHNVIIDTGLLNLEAGCVNQ